MDRLGPLAEELGATQVAVVSDAGVRAAGYVDRAIDSLRDRHIAATIFDAVHENPGSQDVATGAERLAAWHPDVIVGLGGGSAMDCAKGISFLLTNGGRMEDYWGYGKATAPLIPIIAIPTTAGTGSEAQSYALISHAETHAKMACGDPGALPKIAVLDPQLLADHAASSRRVGSRGCHKSRRGVVGHAETSSGLVDVRPRGVSPSHRLRSGMGGTTSGGCRRTVRHAMGGVSGRHGDRKLDAGRRARLGQSADVPGRASRMGRPSG